MTSSADNRRRAGNHLFNILSGECSKNQSGHRRSDDNKGDIGQGFLRAHDFPDDDHAGKGKGGSGQQQSQGRSLSHARAEESRKKE